MPEVQAEWLASIGGQELSPSGVRLYLKEGAEVRLKQAEGSRRNGRFLARRNHVRQYARQKATNQEA